MSLVDSHAHLDFEDFQGDVDGVVSRAAAVGVDRIVVVGLWRAPGSFGNALELARSRPGVFAATIGIHPHECARVPEADWEESARLAADPAVVAVGETGLDYHYDLSPREVQRESFRRSIRIAHAAGKPLVVHVREAEGDCVAILREEGIPPAGGVIHCFTGDRAAARSYLELGLHISVAGIVTFKTAEEIREAVRLVPRDRLLVETDSPFLAPVPFRGKRNEPAHVVHVAAKVAEIWGVSPGEVAEVTTANVKRLFRLA
ncbi:MAG: TatD family hydrolase [Deltaproteobacteria bacterium]